MKSFDPGERPEGEAVHRLWQRPANRLEVWGGVECTLVRLGEEYRDQLLETGHRDRIDDLDAVADLGIRTLRYSVLWETVSPDEPDRCDWSWHDERLERIRSLGITPIIGLIHHGSGPRYTDLLDTQFADGLARHAARVAERYPWLTLFTPVNEPVTTARFSGLYGHWYPHLRDEGAFYRMVVNQMRGVVLAMQAIRQVIPHAQLVQTEDMGKTFSTGRLQYQADYENERRWMSFDLLCGRIDAGHALYRHLLLHGVTEADLNWFRENALPPDIMGVNHYLTSERYLDESWWNYPADLRGGNSHDAYADAEAVRIPWLQDEVGPAARMREVWERYRRPIAITEAHHGLTDAVQCRWLMEVCKAARQLQSEGVDMRAVTIWSLFGVVDWNSLLLRREGFYEPGAFDMRQTPPRPTLLADAVRQLTSVGTFDSEGATPLGWWRHPNRFYEAMRETRRAL